MDELEQPEIHALQLKRKLDKKEVPELVVKGSDDSVEHANSPSEQSDDGDKSEEESDKDGECEKDESDGSDISDKGSEGKAISKWVSKQDETMQYVP